MRAILLLITASVCAASVQTSSCCGSSGHNNTYAGTKVYQIFLDASVRKSWIDALIFCKERRMDLATIRSEEENDFFKETVQNEGPPYPHSDQVAIERVYCTNKPKIIVRSGVSAFNQMNLVHDAIWIGGTIKNSSRGWFWMSDGEPLTYTNWESGEPNNQGGNEECLAWESTRKHEWNDFGCDVARCFACEYSH